MQAFLTSKRIWLLALTALTTLLGYQQQIVSVLPLKYQALAVAVLAAGTKVWDEYQKAQVPA